MPFLLAVAASALSLQIEVPQDRVLVGEPLKIVARWRATGDRPATIALEDDDFTSQVLRFWVNDGSTERLYKEAGRAGDGMVVTMDLAAGQEVATNLVLLRGSYISDSAPLTYDLVFPRPGEYRIRAEYNGPGSGADRGARPGVMSNGVRIVAEQPKGADADILALSLENRLILDGRGSVRQLDRLAKAIAAFPESSYLRWARLRLLDFKGAAGAGGDDSLALLSLRRSDPVAYRRHIALFYRELANEILAFGNWGVFEEDALAQAYRFARSGEDEDLMRQLRERLLATYPRSRYVDEVRAPQRAQ